MNIPLFGSIIGFSIAVYRIISIQDIIIRPDSDGNKVYTFKNLIEYLKLPFDKTKINIAWPNPIKDRGRFITMNWLFMTFAGGLTGYCIKRIFL